MKKKFKLYPGSIQQELDPPDVVTEPQVEDFTLIEENDTLPKREFIDIILRGSVYAPAGLETRTLDAGIVVENQQHGIRVFGQRKIEIYGGQPHFSSPEPFDMVPLTWQEAYGGNDELNKHTGDIWDLKNLGESMGKDLSHLNLCRYRRNPLGKGYIMDLKPEHDGMLLPRVEMAHDLLTPDRIQNPAPMDWHFQPLPACFDWSHYYWFPRIAFMAEKLFGKVEKTLPHQPALPEYHYGYSRNDLFEPLPAHELIKHPRMFNGAHPALQIPNKRKNLSITLWHMDREFSQFSFVLPYKQPRVFLHVPGETKTYKDKSFLSNVIIDTDKKELITTWHSLIHSKYPIATENHHKISLRIDW
jgi:hypothetical protein